MGMFYYRLFLTAAMPSMMNGKFILISCWPCWATTFSLSVTALAARSLLNACSNLPLTAPAKRLILVSAAYDDESIENLGSFKIDSANRLQDSAKKLHLFHSQDDFVAPFTELTKFQQDLPAATAHVFSDRNHFFQPTFPELLELIKK